MRNAECGVGNQFNSYFLRIPHSEFPIPLTSYFFRIPHSAFRIPHSGSRFSRSGCWNRRAPARPCGRGKLAQFSLLQRFAVWWVAPPWPILSVPAVLLALCRLVDSFPVKHSTPAQRLVGSADVAMRSFGGPFSDSRRDRTEMRYTVPGLVATARRHRSAEKQRPVGRAPPRLSGPFKGNWPRVWTGLAWANSKAESSGRV